MTRRHRTYVSLLAVVPLAVIAGCSGGNTYGTGKTQEAQLYEDLTGIVALGGNKKKTRINYNQRSKLVKPPKTSGLPSPVEDGENQAGFFPRNPEERRQDLYAAIEEAERNGGELPPEVIAARAESARSATRGPNTVGDNRVEKYESPEEVAQRRKRFRELVAQSNGGLAGTAPRKYLTQPKSVYRTPAETAPQGVVGEKIESEARRKRKKDNLWSVLTGRK